MEKLIPKIFAKIKKTPCDITAYQLQFCTSKHIVTEMESEVIYNA